MPFAEDMTAFFNPAEFASNATLGGVSVRGVFDAQYASEYDVSGTSPTLTLATADCAGVVVGGTVAIIGSTSYTVTQHQPDGTGVSVLRLREV